MKYRVSWGYWQATDHDTFAEALASYVEHIAEPFVDITGPGYDFDPERGVCAGLTEAESDAVDAADEMRVAS